MRTPNLLRVRIENNGATAWLVFSLRVRIVNNTAMHFNAYP